ncbi:hypothetical protein NGTWS1803_13340 [Mycolicibacterium cyprinidarum]|nr:hypothetical protein NGTWS1803_13340 [Mycolicibacterium sp. NGTWS1803]
MLRADLLRAQARTRFVCMAWSARSSWPEAIVAMLTLTLPRELTFTCSTKGRASFWAWAGRIARLRAVPARYPLVPAG